MKTLLILLLLQEAAALQKELEYANDAERPQYQGQAVKKLKARGEAAVEPILQYVEKKGKNALAVFFVEFLGEITDERISKLLAGLVQDREFFWRPAAARALALHRRPTDRDLFRSLLGDPLWGVRLGALQGLEGVGDKESAPQIMKRLDDDQYDVRSQAARTLHAFGDESGLPVLVESLAIEHAWFDIDYGQLAREDAWNFLKKLTKDDFGYKPWESPRERSAGLKRWQAWMAARDPKWREKVPPKARAREIPSDYLFGFELRSCQWGDFFFRFDAQGNFVLGFFNLESRPLSPEQRQRLEKAVDDLKKIDRSVPYGRGGCDFEQYYLKNERGGFDKLWIGKEGRPGEADPFIKVVTEILKAQFGDGVAKEFRDTTKLFRGPE